MVDRPKQTGLDKALTFLSIATGNAGAVIQQQQKDLTAYDTAVKQEQATINLAMSNIEVGKVQNYVNTYIADNEDEVAGWTDAQYNDFINSVPARVGVNLNQFDDPISNMNLIAKINVVNEKGAAAVKTLQTARNKQVLEQQVVQGIAAYKDDDDPQGFIDYMDSIHTLAGQYGIEYAGLKNIVTDWVEQNSETYGGNAITKWAFGSKAFGKNYKQRATVEGNLLKHKEKLVVDAVGSMYNDIVIGASGLSETQVESRVIKMYDSVTDPTKKKSIVDMTKKMMVAQVKAGMPLKDLLGSGLAKAFKHMDGFGKNPDILETLRKAADEYNKGLEFDLLATAYSTGAISGEQRNTYNDMSAADKQKVTDIAYNKLDVRYTATPDILDEIGGVQAIDMAEHEMAVINLIRTTGVLPTTIQDQQAILTPFFEDVNFNIDDNREAVQTATRTALIMHQNGINPQGMFNKKTQRIYDWYLRLLGASGGSVDYALETAKKIVDLDDAGALPIFKGEDFEPELWKLLNGRLVFGKGVLADSENVINKGALLNLFQTKHSQYLVYNNPDRARDLTEEWFREHVAVQKLEHNNEYIYKVPYDRVAVGREGGTITGFEAFELIRKEYLYDEDVAALIGQAGWTQKDLEVAFINVPGDDNKTRITVFHKKSGKVVTGLDRVFFNNTLYNNPDYIQALSTAEAIRKAKKKQDKEERSPDPEDENLVPGGA